MDARLRAMGRALARVQDADPPLDLDAQRARFVQHALQPVPRAWRRGRVYGALAVALLGLVVLILRPAPSALPSAKLTYAVAGAPGPASDWVSAPANASLPLRFSDGSVLTLASGSRARVVETSAQGALVVLEQGRISVHVLHRAHTDFRFKAGPFEVRVIGTRFELAWDHARERFELTMHEGAVQVQGPGSSEARTFRAGERLAFAPDALDMRTPSAPPPTPTVAREDVHEPAPPARSMSAPSRPGPKELARLAEAARFAGRPEQAADALLALRARFARDAQAHDSAFLLGRLYSDQLAAPAEAARWFQVYLRERPDGPFAREASGRLIESFMRLADDSAARDAARAYLARYPEGPHARLARQLLTISTVGP